LRCLQHCLLLQQLLEPRLQASLLQGIHSQRKSPLLLPLLHHLL
jgi:hypothetical protein